MAKTLSQTDTIWEIARPAPKAFLAKFPERPAAVAQLLYNRGLRDDAAVSTFLNPVYTRDLHNPRLLKGMDQAVGVITRAITAKQRIVIHGDYDADGITATACLYQALTTLGANVSTFIPGRYLEGYGVAAETLTRLRRQGADVVITVDCGISSAEAIEQAEQNDLRVIVTDHHLPPPVLPKASAVVNPNQPGDNYPNKSLTGAGVAFKLSQGLLRESDLTESEVEAHEKWLLDLVAIGTVADIASLTGENRTLVKYGLVVLQKTRRPGLRELLKLCRITGAVEASQIGYLIGPRLNAPGRLSHAGQALELLLTDDEDRAFTLARELHELNAQRQSATTEAYAEAKTRLGEVTDDDRILVVDGKFLGGIVGLVAGKLSKEYTRPALVIDRGAQVSHGSARSTAALNIVEALKSQQDILTTFGGHAGAAGFSLPTVRLEEFRTALADYGRAHLTPDDLKKRLEIEAVLNPESLSFSLLEELALFEPFGIDNPRPLFLLPDVKTETLEVVGKEHAHVKLRLRLPSGEVLTALGFGLANLLEFFRSEPNLDLVGSPVANTFNHHKSLEWHITDCRRAQSVAQ